MVTQLLDLSCDRSVVLAKLDLRHETAGLCSMCRRYSQDSTRRYLGESVDKGNRNWSVAHTNKFVLVGQDARLVLT